MPKTAKYLKSIVVMVGAILSMQLLIGVSDTYGHGKEKHPRNNRSSLNR